MKFSKEVVEEFKNMLKENEKDKKIRISLSKGCCGPSFSFDMVEKEIEGDIKVEDNDFAIWVDPAAYDLLKDFSIEFDGSQFFLQKL